MATSKTKKISLVDQMDIRKSKSSKNYLGGGGIEQPGMSSEFDRPDSAVPGLDPEAEGSGNANAMVGTGLALVNTATQSINTNPNQVPSVGGQALKRAAQGAQMGMAAGPWGAAVGAAAGGIGGAIEENINKQKFEKTQKELIGSAKDAASRGSIYNTMAGYNQFANGGSVKPYKKSDWILNENNSNNYNYSASSGSEGVSAGSGYYEGGDVGRKIMYKHGSGIHIKPENKGKFTASAKAAGEGVQEHAHSVVGNPNSSETQRKRAQFAINAKKWHHADGGETLAKINDMSASNTKPSLMHWMTPSWMPGHMKNGGPMKPSTIVGGVSASDIDGAAMLAEGGMISNKSEITAPQGTYVDEYIDNLPHEGQVRYNKGGKVSHQFGVIPGNGDPKADDKNLMADQGGFVVPANKVPKVKPLLAMAGYDPNTRLAMSKGGEAPIKISSKELYMNNEVKEEVQEAAGMDDEDIERELSPNSEHNKHYNTMANGGHMKKSPVSMDENFHKYQRKDYYGGGNMGYQTGGPFEEEETNPHVSFYRPGANLLEPNKNWNTGNPYRDMGLLGLAENNKYTPENNNPANFKVPSNEELANEEFNPPGQVPDQQAAQKKEDNAYMAVQQTQPSNKYVGMDVSPEEKVALAPYDLREDQYAEYNKANNLISGGKAVALAGTTLWNAMQKYKAGPQPTQLSDNTYERNFEAMRGKMTRDLVQSQATARYNARNLNQTAATNVGLAADDTSQRTKISEVIGDKQEDEKVRKSEIGRDITNKNRVRMDEWAGKTASEAAAFTAQKGQVISQNIGQLGDVGTDYLNTKLGIGGIKSAEKSEQLMSQVYADARSNDPERVKRANSILDYMDISSRGRLPLTYSNKNKSTDAQNVGG